MTIARWGDVRRAKALIIRRRLDERQAAEASLATSMHGAGYSEREVAERLEVSQSTIHRRTTSFVDEVLQELGCLPS